MNIIMIIFLLIMSINIVYVAACVAIYISKSHMKDIYEGKEGDNHE